MPDDWELPDWSRAAFAGEGAEDGAIVLHAAADPGRVWRGAEALIRQHGFDDHCREYMFSRPVEVVDAV
eukprot:6595119-Alexandrium_andersonii.AAC.1